MGIGTSKLEAWKRAEAQARAVEREARALLLKRAKGDRIDNIEEKLAEASALRCVAHRLLEEALLDARVAADALHYRNITTPTIRSFASWHREFMMTGSQTDQPRTEEDLPRDEAVRPPPEFEQRRPKNGDD